MASAGNAVSQVIGKAVRDGKLCYYINDGVYHTYSGVIFDHCKYRLRRSRRARPQICSVFGPTCDALDPSLGRAPPRPRARRFRLQRKHGRLGRRTTSFNGFPPAKVVHVNQ